LKIETKIELMQLSFFPSNSRGHANYGWLDTYYSYSFANYFNPDRMGFGPLRVLNDDTIAPSSGFPFHSHNNMEIITIMESGEITHKDSMGNQSVLMSGQIQVMSAGTGVTHSEMNDGHAVTKLLQIWIEPSKLDITPRYEETSFVSPNNSITTLISPLNDTNGSIQINQHAYISLGNFVGRHTVNYKKLFSKESHGIAIFVLDGSIEISDQVIDTRDMCELTDVQEISITILDNAKFLIFDV
jgi:quercetin 2,3-dioxygenase